ncbi:hypothetical protein ACUOFC_47085, partial [Escherichia sp. TWPC-MK]
DKLDQALDSLLAQPMVQGGVVLSTCNRTELYLSVEEQDNLQEALIRWLCDYHNLNEEDLRKSLYWHQDNDAVSHLMRVASGLDSLVLGEPQKRQTQHWHRYLFQCERVSRQRKI